MSETQTSSIPFSLVPFLIFLVLKLTNTVAWSWWIVTMPLWLPFAIVGVLIAATLVVAGTCKVADMIGGGK